MPFFWPKFRFLVQKSDFCHTTPILVDDPFLALGMTVNFPPWKPFFDFPFRSYSCFRKKNPADGSKSLPPSHLWEFRLPVTALALFARGLDKMALLNPRTELTDLHLLQTYFPKATTAFTAVTDQNQPAGRHYSQIVYNPQLRSFITDFVGQ